MDRPKTILYLSLGLGLGLSSGIIVCLSLGSVYVTYFSRKCLNLPGWAHDNPDCSLRETDEGISSLLNQNTDSNEIPYRVPVRG